MLIAFSQEFSFQLVLSQFGWIQEIEFVALNLGSGMVRRESLDRILMQTLLLAFSLYFYILNEKKLF